MKKIIFILTLVTALAACATSNGSDRRKKVEKYGIEVLQQYPHDRHAYTQGLFFHQGKLYESTGQYGESSFRICSDLENGKLDTLINFKKDYFMEGSVIFKDQLYVMTWVNGVVFVYDAESLKFKKSIGYPRQGWGLTTDGRQLIASDGSANLYFMDENLKVSRTVTVRKDGRPVQYLNELEYIDGKIWANIYTTDEIVIIDPETCRVEGSIDCTGLLNDIFRTPDTDVLNGIACNPADGKIYLTGKNWPLLFEVKLIRK